MDWKEMVKTVAPLLGAALPLPPPLGTLAVKVVTDALLGKDAPASPKEAAKALETALASGDPAVLLKVREVETAFTITMRSLDVDLEKMAVEQSRVDAGDRASARQMKTSTGSYAPEIVSALVIVGYFYIMAWLLKYGVPKDEPNGIIFMLIGALTAAFGSVVQYWLGSSRSSTVKDALLMRRN